MNLLSGRFCGWLNYDLTKAAFWLRGHGWRLRCHVLTVGPVAFCILWKVHQEEEGGDVSEPGQEPWQRCQGLAKASEEALGSVVRWLEESAALVHILAPIANKSPHILRAVVQELRSQGAGRYRNAVAEMLSRALDYLEGMEADGGDQG